MEARADLPVLHDVKLMKQSPKASNINHLLKMDLWCLGELFRSFCKGGLQHAVLYVEECV